MTRRFVVILETGQGIVVARCPILQGHYKDVLRYLKPEATVILLSCEGEKISVGLPRRMSFAVVQCDPASKGIAGATKDATVDNGSIFKVPLFIKPGDVVVIEVGLAAERRLRLAQGDVIGVLMERNRNGRETDENSPARVQDIGAQ